MIWDISVEGFDTCSLQNYALKLALRKHFASCGKVLAISFIKSVAFMKIEGANAEEKALALSGTDVGGWYAIVKATPFARENKPYDPRIKSAWIDVKGYDTCLPKIDIQIALCKHFSSCGEVTDIKVLPTSRAFITIKGERCEEKALELSGRDVGGMNLVVAPVARRRENITRKWVSLNVIRNLLPSPFREQLLEEYKMLKEEKEKEKDMVREMKMEK